MADTPHGAGRIARLTGLVAAGVVALLVLGFWLLFPPLAERALRDIPGLHSVDIRHVSPWSAELANLRLGDDAVAIERLTLAFSPRLLLDGRIDAATIEGVTIRARWTDGGPTLPGLPLPSGENGQASPSLPELPFGRLTIRDARFSLAGEVRAEFPFALDLLTDRGRPVSLAVALPQGARVEAAALRPFIEQAGLDPQSLPQSLPIPVDGPASLTLAGLTEPGLTLDAWLRDGAFFVPLQARLDLVGAAAKAEIRLDGQAELWPSDLVPRHLDLRHAEAKLAGLATPWGILDGHVVSGPWQGMPPNVEAPLTFSATLNKARLPGVTAQTVSVSSQGVMRLDGLRLAYAATQGGVITAQKVAADTGVTVEALTLPLAARDQPIIDAALVVGDGIDLRLDLRSLPDDAEVTVAGNPPRRFAVRLPHLSLTAQGVLPRDNLAARFSFAQGRIAFAETPAPIAPITLSGEGRITERGLVVEGVGWVAGVWPVPFRLTPDTLVLDAAPIAFTPGGTQPGTVFPALADDFEEISGQFGIAGRIDLAARPGRTSLELLARDLTGQAFGVTLARLNTVVELDNVAPISTPADQLISVGLVEAGLPLSDVLARFHIDQGILHLDEARLALAGGILRIDDASIAASPQAQKLVLQVAGLDLGELAEMAEIDGLSATGQLGGTLPLVLSGSGVAIKNGRLAATSPGIIRYDPANSSQGLGQGNPSVALAQEALRNFHYKSLTLSLEGDAMGELSASLGMSGANPELYGGYPVEFNLNIGGNLAEILDKTLTGYQIPDRIRNRMSGFGAKP